MDNDSYESRELKICPNENYDVNVKYVIDPNDTVFIPMKNYYNCYCYYISAVQKLRSSITFMNWIKTMKYKSNSEEKIQKEAFDNVFMIFKIYDVIVELMRKSENVNERSEKDNNLKESENNNNLKESENNNNLKETMNTLKQNTNTNMSKLKQLLIQSNETQNSETELNDLLNNITLTQSNEKLNTNDLFNINDLWAIYDDEVIKKYFTDDHTGGNTSAAIYKFFLPLIYNEFINLNDESKNTFIKIISELNLEYYLVKSEIELFNMNIFKEDTFNNFISNSYNNFLMFLSNKGLHDVYLNINSENFSSVILTSIYLKDIPGHAVITIITKRNNGIVNKRDPHNYTLYVIDDNKLLPMDVFLINNRNRFYKLTLLNFPNGIIHCFENKNESEPIYRIEMRLYSTNITLLSKRNETLTGGKVEEKQIDNKLTEGIKTNNSTNDIINKFNHSDKIDSTISYFNFKNICIMLIIFLNILIVVIIVMLIRFKNEKRRNDKEINDIKVKIESFKNNNKPLDYYTAKQNIENIKRMNEKEENMNNINNMNNTSNMNNMNKFKDNSNSISSFNPETINGKNLNNVFGLEVRY